MTKISSRYACLVILTPGQLPTIPTPVDLEAGQAGWVDATDIHVGEWAFNRPDNKWYYREGNSIKPITEDASLLSALNSKANDSNVVKLNGDQTVGGNKYLSGSTSANRNTRIEITSDYTLVIGDRGCRIVANDDDPIEITIPPESAETWTDDSEIEIYRRGAGSVTIAAGVGVTLESLDNKKSIAHRYTSVFLKREASDEWSIQGNLG